MTSSATLARLHALFEAGTLPAAETLLALEIWSANSEGELQRLDASGELVDLLIDLTLPLRFSAVFHAIHPERPHAQRFHIACIPLELPPDPRLLEEARATTEFSFDMPAGEVRVLRTLTEEQP